MAPRRARGARKATKSRKGLKRAAPKLYKAIKAVAKSEALKTQETKLVITQPFVGGTAGADLITNRFISQVNVGNLNYLQLAIPTIQASGGTEQSNNIIGSKIRLVAGTTDFLVSLRSDYSPAQDIIVKIFCVHSKSAKSLQTAKNLPTDDFLRRGDATTIDWQPTALAIYPPLMEDFPVNTLAWKVSKVFTCRLSKNAGLMNGADVTSSIAPVPNLSAHVANHKFKWHWGKDGPEVLRYEEPLQVVNDNYPNNFAPMYAACAYYADGTALGEAGASLPVSMAVSNTMYFKDA